MHDASMIYGYARVSTDAQDLTSQVAQLKAAGCATIFREIASGAQTDRAQLHEMQAALEASDLRMVTRLDRLARPTRDLPNTIST